ncbi:MAG: 4-hydroxy-tetrahydrodipicolinate reductase [Planctomycetota bacterium]|nr:MAG: 4-hydroxy-tetrahydrodipicolinate reductase [Planctomycetota bacterium]
MNAVDRTAPDVTRVIVAGAAGRMGRLACEWIRASSHDAATPSTERVELELVAELRRGDPVDTLLAQHPGAVLLDLTLAAASVPLSTRAVELGLHPVIGTSGWDPAQLDALERRCAAARLGALWVPNFSIGALLQMRAAEEAARWFAHAEISELHHPTKRDTPSGTARATAERMRAVRAGEERVPIHSERREGALAEQRVRLANEHEVLELGHVVSDRRAYAPGLLLALRRVRGLSTLVRGLDSLL